MKAKFCSLFACLVLFLPTLLKAQGNNILTVVPDGRQGSDSIPPNTGTSYLFSPQPGHSYSVEQSRGLNRPTMPMWVASGCPGNYPADTSTMVPAVTLNTGSRRSGREYRLPAWDRFILPTSKILLPSRFRTLAVRMH